LEELIRLLSLHVIYLKCLKIVNGT
jgi:hypothetical protein